MARSRDRKRRILPIILLVAVTAAVVRMAGPAVVSVGGDGIAPLIQRGDLLFARRLRQVPARETIVFTRNHSPTDAFILQRVQQFIAARRGVRIEETGPSRTIPRILAAVPGDTVRFDGGTVTVFGENGYVRRYDVRPFHESLSSPSEQVVIGEDEVFLLATRSGFVDSRVLGPVAVRDLRFTAIAILWPAHRRSRL